MNTTASDRCVKCRLYACRACGGKGEGGATLRPLGGKARKLTCSACGGTGRGKCKDHRG